MVLGIDGLPYSLALRLAEAGVLERLGPLVLSDRAGAMRAELPEVSPVNWTSFFTAVSPAEHGIFGFTRIHPYTYRIELTDFTGVRVPTLFDRLAERGLTSLALNLPGLGPVRPPKGHAGAVEKSALVAGFPAHDLETGVHPPWLAAELARAGYAIEGDVERGGRDFDALFRELRASLEGRRRLRGLVWRGGDFDCCVFTLTETDRLFHFLYPALEENGHPRHGECLDLMRRLDAVAGEALDAFAALSGPTRLICMADHGFGRLEVEIDLNALLREMGHLVTSRPPAHELDGTVIDGRTRAFALDPGRIYVHRADRFHKGTVGPDEAENLVRELQATLAAFEWKGERVFEQVLRADEAYTTGGVAMAQAPDLVCVARPGFDLKAKLDRREVGLRLHRAGSHRPEDAFFYDSQGKRFAGPADVGRAVLEFFGVEQESGGGRIVTGTRA